MEAPALLLLAFTPGLFWLWFFSKRHAYRPGPKKLIAITFLLGMASTIPAGIMNTIFLDESLLDDRSANLASVAVGMLFVVGPVEETCKFLAVRLYAFRSRYFDQPSDGLLYAAAASLGFASLENLLYILQFGPEVMILRAPLSTLAHVIFGSFWGYALGKRTEQGTSLAGPAVIGSIVVAAAVHGLFNVSVFIFPMASLAIVGLGLWWVLSRFKWARMVSPFRYRRNYPRSTCPRCGSLISVAGRFCIYCGMRVSRQLGGLQCSNCGSMNRADAGFCIKCGDRLEIPRC